MNYDDQQMSSYLEILLHDSDALLPDFAELAPSQTFNTFTDIHQQQQQQQEDNNPAAFQQLTNYYDSAPSPPLSTVSNSSTVFTFPTPAPTPEAALPLAESLVETPNIDISLFGPNSLFNSGTDDKKDVGVFGTVNVMPMDSKVHVKEELASYIKQRRLASGLPEEVELSDDDEQTPRNQLTKTDVIRRERRKASNRRAATKCRLKKKAADDLMLQAMQRLRDENSCLRKEVESLNTSRRELEERLTGHLAVCPQR